MNVDLTPFGYRNRADGARSIASKTADSVTRRLLLDVAADYDEVAQALERILAMQQLINRRVVNLNEFSRSP